MHVHIDTSLVGSPTILASHPDIAYPGRKVAIFVNGCFWHRCPHCKPPLPKSNPDFWQAKFAANEVRDALKAAQLREAGWAVITVWECQLRDDTTGVVNGITAELAACSRP